MINHPTLAPFAFKGSRLYALFSVRTAGFDRVSTFKQSQWRAVPQKAYTQAAIVALLMLIGTILPTPAFASTSASPDISLNAQAVVDSINHIRASNGLPYLALNPHLVQAAQTHVVDMVTNSHHSHTGTDGSSVRTRVARTGYGAGSWAGENWVALTDPTKAVDWWMASPPHRGNILNTSWQEIGIGAGVNTNSGLNYFVVVFAKRGDGQAVAAPVNNVVGQATAQSVPAVLPEFHHVQSGETLSSIATRYGLAWQSVATINNLGEYSILSIGQALRLPSNGPLRNTGGPSATQNLPYRVVAGDTLFTLGGKFNVPWQTIAHHNGLSENSILSIEQVLQIPVATNTINEAILEDRSFAPPKITPETHVVQAGETIIIIALQYDMNWKQLLSLNALTDSTLLAVGQTIRLK